MRFNVEYRPLMDFLPLPRVQWRLTRVDGILMANMIGHPGVIVYRQPNEAMLTCRCAGEEANMSTLHGAMTWCEHNLHNTTTVE